MGRYRFLANNVEAVRMRTDAGTIAVRAPAPPTTPSIQAGKALRTMVNMERSPLLSPGTTRNAANPVNIMNAREIPYRGIATVLRRSVSPLLAVKLAPKA